jgi:hypothetical protein
MSVASTANEHSEEFRPAFAVVSDKSRTGHGRYQPLNIGYRWVRNLPFPLPADDEQLLGHCSVMLSSFGAMNLNCEPPRVAGGGGNFRIVKIADGVGRLMVTNRRVVALLSNAQTVTGQVSPARGNLLALVMTLAEVDAVTLNRRPAAFGGKLKESGTSVEDTSHAAVLKIERAMDIRGEAPIGAGTGSPLSRLASLIAETAARSRRALDVPGPERDALDRVLNGERDADGHDLVARLRA